MDSRWYLVQCKPKQSFRAELHLTNQGYTCFHPTHPVKKKVKQQNGPVIKTTIQPLFPHYLFISLSNFDSWFTIRSTRGVNRIVTFDGRPTSLCSTIVEGIRRHCDRLNGLEPPPLFKRGDKVKITEGSFKEIEAVITAATGEERVMLLLNLFNRQHELEFPVTALTAING